MLTDDWFRIRGFASRAGMTVVHTRHLCETGGLFILLRKPSRSLVLSRTGLFLIGFLDPLSALIERPRAAPSPFVQGPRHDSGPGPNLRGK